MKYCILDVETTGLNFYRHGILQIAGLIEVDDITHEEFNFFVQPFTSDEVTEEALQINGITADQWKTDPKFLTPGAVHRHLSEIFNRYVDKFDRTDKFFMAGFNCCFDYSFFRKFWEKNQDQYFGSYFWYPPIDVMVMAGWYLAPQRHSLENFKLGTVAKHMGVVVPDGKAHDASYDTRIAKGIFDILRGREQEVF